MAQFAWEGRTRAGEVRKGTMEAEAEPEVANRLRAQGITMSKAKKKAKDIEIKLPFGWGQGVPEKDLVVFTRQFATMIDAGLPIVQCLDILAHAVAEQELPEDALRRRRRRSSRARPSPTRCKQAPARSFDDLYANLVQAGEVGGILDTILHAPRDLHRKGDEAEVAGQGRDGLPDLDLDRRRRSSSSCSCGRSSPSSKTCSRTSAAARCRSRRRSSSTSPTRSSITSFLIMGSLVGIVVGVPAAHTNQEGARASSTSSS